MLRKILLGGVLTAALAMAGLSGRIPIGTAWAQTSSTVETTVESTQPAQPVAAAESDQPDQATEAAGGPQEQQPSYTSSVTVPQDQEGSGQVDDAASLQGKAKITADQAKAAALDQFKGATVQKVELENENGNVVYSVQLTDATGKPQDVKVDAGNGKILHVEADGSDSHDSPEDVGGKGEDNAKG